MTGTGRTHTRALRALAIGILVSVVGLSPTLMGQATASPSAKAPATSGAPSASAPAPSAESRSFTINRRPKIHGQRRYLHTLTAGRGSISPTPKRYAYRWFRDGRPIKKATKRRYQLTASDFGHRMSVRVVAKRPGYTNKSTKSGKTRKVQHRVAQKRVIRYKIVSNGRIVTSFSTFKRQVKESLNDPRGWRINGTAFAPTKGRDSGMTIVLAESSKMTSYSSGCSNEWSCRVGRYVVINQKRWRFATPAWNGAGGSLRGYRHMVVGHETGHWLGWSHRSCPRRGAKAPLMQTQSKGLAGCRFNPFPTKPEWNVPRYRPADWGTRVDVE